MFSQVTEAAKKFAREFDNEDFRLVRSANSFDKFAAAEGIDLKTTKLKSEGAVKKRYAIWVSKVGYGVIGNKKDVDKFIKLCDEVEDTAPKRRGRVAKEKNEDAPKKRGPKYITEEHVSKRGRKPKQEVDVSNVDEPEIELDIDPDFPVRKNIKEFTKGFKIMFDFLGVDPDTIDPKKLTELISESKTIRELFFHAAETFN